ncbi:MAG: serine/threonine protein kinase [Thermoguttaceae bacterium]|nr:serine/threonine protein kinase [Thermoguttaceae bacterium]MDW8037325.1 serine/threonine-protein kinase [Thermoguttaceae bacterium]
MELEWLGPYQLIRKLGRGGMGVVYEGVDVETGQRAALKVLSAALGEDEDFRVRFETEIETLRKLKHPNIVRLLGFGQQEGRLFYAMELVDGPSLESELRRGRRFRWQEAVEIGLQICRGLRHAHDRGIIHRDLKPSNLLLAADGTVKLADFGIAQLFGRNRLTAVGSVVGTLDYMAPEQAQGGLVDGRADLYSLGAVLYSLISGRPPLRAKTLAEMLEKLHCSRPEPIRRLAPEVPEAFEQLLEQLLEKDPQRRIATAQIAARRLESLLQGGASSEAFPSASVGVEIKPPLEPAPGARMQPIGSVGFAAESILEKEPIPHGAKGSDAASLAEEGPGELPETQPMTSVPGLAYAEPSYPEPPAGLISGEKKPSGPEKVAGQNGLPPPLENSSGCEPQAYDQLAPTQQATQPELGSPISQPPEEILPPSVPKPPLPAEQLPRQIPDSAKLSHFTPVSEHELDQMPPEEPVRPWISWQTWVLAAGLLATGGTVWYLLQPPSADSLYDRITRAAQDGTIESLRGVDSAIQQFLSRYPGDPRAEQIRHYERELDLDRLERRFELQAAGRLQRHGFLSPCERAYAEAVAISRTNPDLGMVKLQALLDLYENRSERSGPIGACLELARRRLQRLQQQQKEQIASVVQVLEERLQRAKQLETSAPETARAIRQAIVELYADKPWAASLVARAKAALAQSASLPSSQPTATPPPP